MVALLLLLPSPHFLRTALINQEVCHLQLNYHKQHCPHFCDLRFETSKSTTLSRTAFGAPRDVEADFSDHTIHTTASRARRLDDGAAPHKHPPRTIASVIVV